MGRGTSTPASAHPWRAADQPAFVGLVTGHDRGRPGGVRDHVEALAHADGQQERGVREPRSAGNLPVGACCHTLN